MRMLRGMQDEDEAGVHSLLGINSRHLFHPCALEDPGKVLQ